MTDRNDGRERGGFRVPGGYRGSNPTPTAESPRSKKVKLSDRISVVGPIVGLSVGILVLGIIFRVAWALIAAAGIISILDSGPGFWNLFFALFGTAMLIGTLTGKKS